MKWKREKLGTYTSGPYCVERYLGNAWRAAGPGLNPEVIWHTKVLAQDECRRALQRRITKASHEVVQMCEPVVGDAVLVIKHERRGRLGSVLPPRGNQNELTRQKLYCINFPYGKRLCLFRDEFEVVVP